jgi:diguanylate cyclase (GGDEF)-like protein/PAS domain S-box-containing protein
VTLRVRRGDGAWSSVEVFGVNQLEVDDIGAVLLMIHDVSGRPVADRVLAAGEYLYRNLATTATDFTIITNAALEPLYVSPSITAVLGWQAAQLSVPRPFGLTHPDDRRRMENEVDAALAAPGSAHRIDARCRRSDGSHVWVDFTIVNLLDDPVIEGLVFHARNIDERRRAADQLFHLALHDPLTGLPNRQHFVDHLDALMLETDVTSVTVLYCDLVDFKPVNDHHGHAAGDELLRHAGQRLRRAVRPDDLVARVGGDEFCIVCTDIDVDRAQELGQRVLRAFDEPVELEGLTVAVGISVGVARASGGGRSADLLRRADEAMYRAKARGRNTLHLSDS